jgi:hypothetical protein
MFGINWLIFTGLFWICLLVNTSRGKRGKEKGVTKCDNQYIALPCSFETSVNPFLFLQELSEKSITLLGSESEAHVSIEKVENVNFAGRAVSASKPGEVSYINYVKLLLKT